MRNPNCTLCPLHEGVATVCVSDPWPNYSKNMIIAEAPGQQEDFEGVPFVGRAGRLLEEGLINAGLNRSDFYIRNCVSCRPPNNRVPTESEITTCSSNFLIPDFIKLRPEVVVLLGNTALHTFTIREDGITRNRGYIPFPEHLFIIEDDPDPFIPKVFATMHPASALRSALLKEDLFDDLLTLGKDLVKQNPLLYNP